MYTHNKVINILKNTTQSVIVLPFTTVEKNTKLMEMIVQYE